MYSRLIIDVCTRIPYYTNIICTNDKVIPQMYGIATVYTIRTNEHDSLTRRTFYYDYYCARKKGKERETEWKKERMKSQKKKEGKHNARETQSFAIRA